MLNLKTARDDKTYNAMVQRLIKNDLIKKIQSPEDKRVFHLKLTEKGLKIVQGDDALYCNLANNLANILNEKQLSDIECLLTMLVDQIAESQNINMELL